MAQLVEQRIRNAWVTSSSLVIGSIGMLVCLLCFIWLYYNKSALYQA